MFRYSVATSALALVSFAAWPANAEQADRGSVTTGTTTETTTAADGTTTTKQTTTVASGPAADQAQAAADKAKADLRTAQAQAKAAEIAAVNSALPTSGTSGAVSLQAGAGTEEANALAAVAINDAARQITAKIKDKATDGFLIVAGATLPDFSGWITFNARLKFLKTQFETAQAAYGNAQNMPPAKISQKDFTGIGMVVSSLVKLAQLAATDWSAGGIGLTSDDYMLAVAVASRNPKAVIYNQSNSLDAFTELNDSMEEIDALRVIAVRNSAAAVAESAALKAKAKTAKKGADEMNAKAAALDSAVTLLNAAVAAYDAFLGQLSGASAASAATTTVTTAPTLGVILQQKAAFDTSQNGGALFLRVHNSSGGVITKKNLWSAFGAMPFYASGGVVVSYSFVKKDTDRVSGLLPVVTPYNKVIYTRDIINFGCDNEPADAAGKAQYRKLCPGGSSASN